MGLPSWWSPDGSPPWSSRTRSRGHTEDRERTAVSLGAAQGGRCPESASQEAVGHQEKTIDQWDKSLLSARGQGANPHPRVSWDYVWPPQSFTPGVSQTGSECGRETSRAGSLHFQNSRAHRGHNQNRPSPSSLPAPRRQVLTPQFTREPTSLPFRPEQKAAKSLGRRGPELSTGEHAQPK